MTGTVTSRGDADRVAVLAWAGVVGVAATTRCGRSSRLSYLCASVIP